MAVSKGTIEKRIKPYLIEVDGMTFLDGEKVDEATTEILSSYSNVYTSVEKNPNGRSKFIVGNAIKHVGKPIYEIYVYDDEITGWKYFEFNKPYEGKAITSIRGVQLPKQYIEFMKKHNGGEGDIGSSWLVLEKLEDLEVVNDDYDDILPPGKIIIGSNGSEELFGIDENGRYFNVPDIYEEEYLTYLGDDIDELPKRINEFWDSIENDE